jgi:hypothetical protein
MDDTNEKIIYLSDYFKKSYEKFISENTPKYTDNFENKRYKVLSLKENNYNFKTIAIVTIASVGIIGILSKPIILIYKKTSQIILSQIILHMNSYKYEVFDLYTLDKKIVKESEIDKHNEETKNICVNCK